MAGGLMGGLNHPPHDATVRTETSAQVPVTITVDARMWRHSGIGRYLRELLPRLMASSAPWYWRLLVQPDQRGSVAERLRAARVDAQYWRLIPCSVPPLSWRDQLDLLNYLPMRYAPKHVYWAPHFNVPFWYRGPLVATIHDVLPLAHPEYVRHRGQSWYVRWLCQKIRRQARAVFFNSRFTEQEFLRLVGMPQGKTLVTPLGVGTAWQVGPAAPTALSIDGVRRDVGAKKEAWPLEVQGAGGAGGAGDVGRVLGSPYVLYCGNVKPHKNLRGLLQAWQHYTGTHRLVVVGRYTELAYADREAHRLAQQLGDRVLWLGSVTDAQLIPLMQRADLLVMPSFYEGFGLPALEAMAVGTPVLVSAIGPFREVGGDAVQYCDPFSPEDIRQKLQRVLGNPAEQHQMRRKGLMRAQDYSWEQCAVLTRELLRQSLTEYSA